MSDRVRTGLLAEVDRLRADLAAKEAQLTERTQERDDYKTLANVGHWHHECRPNRLQAAQTIRDMQATIDKMADAVSASHAERDAALARAERVEGLLRDISWVLADAGVAGGTTIYGGVLTLRERAERAEQGQTWQPMETAPKDGTNFLGCTAHGGHIVTFWSRHYPHHWRCAQDGSSSNVTAWMPLPAPPREDGPR